MMMYHAVNILTGIFEALIIFMLFDAYLNRKRNLSKWAYFAGFMTLAAVIDVFNYFFNLGMLNIVAMIFITMCMTILYDGDIKTKIFISIASIVLFGFIEMLVLFFITVIEGVSVEVAISDESLRLIGIIVSKMLTLGVVKIETIRKKKQAFSMKTSIWILFSIMLLTSMLTLFLIFKLQYHSSSAQMYYLSVLCSIGLLCSTFFTLYLYEHIAKQMEIINKQKIFEQQVNSQAKYLNEILITQGCMRKFRHDLSNHLIALKAFYENSDSDGGLEYINKISSMTKADGVIIETGNIALDAIINTKYTMAQSKHIKFFTNIQIPENLPMQAADICIIFGNALDNAIEACERVLGDDKVIRLSIIYDQDSIMCKIGNTSINDAKQGLQTTKEDKKNHGFGLENINTALSNYNSISKIDQTDDLFVLHFIIFTKFC